MKKMISFLFLLLLAGSLVVANVIPLNGLTTISIAHKLPILLLPADYVFLVRPVLLVVLFCWIVKMRPSSPVSPKRTLLFSAACAANAGWYPLWHFGFFGTAFAVNAATALALYVLYRTYPAKENAWYGRVPISLFLAWTLIDLVLNANYLLVFDDWSRLGISTVLWTILNLTVLTAVALHFSYHHQDGVITAVCLWVFAGIIVNVRTEELFVTLSTLFLMGLMSWGYWFFSAPRVQPIPEETPF
ncbi:hypothetical protein NCCP2716_21530 [Sporosarcina sp. NCCP-2716]|uniref:hypothetical protein n=1 Tax=Sporosarcina sp. NCCP-2716 TaxID=2943679 RepID=UPI00203F50CC|nr:hypothetical protein [Sporosarcina sp. NCCP-2716]GKV69655.1 hypothetical protein NCCP2716_21530 [Sporosarcina sp. NCCP-2716]